MINYRRLAQYHKALPRSMTLALPTFIRTKPALDRLDQGIGIGKEGMDQRILLKSEEPWARIKCFIFNKYVRRNVHSLPPPI